MSFDAGFLLGLSMGGGGGGSEEEWSPPADWPDVPEPGDYEICLLVQIFKENTVLSLTLTDPLSANTGGGNLAFNWGDGTEEEVSDGEWNINNLQHTYTSTGKYVVKVSTSEKSNFLQGISPNYNNSILLIAKLGDEIVINNGSDSHSQNAFGGHYLLKYAKLGGKGGLARQGTFRLAYSLEKVDVTIPPQAIPRDTFSGAYALKKFDFSEVSEISDYGIYQSGFAKLELPKCTNVKTNGFASSYFLNEINLPRVIAMGNNALAYCPFLKSISAPSCTTVGQQGMYSDYSLKKVTVADGCTFGTNCFQGCYNLVPHPDGTDIRK